MSNSIKDACLVGAVVFAGLAVTAVAVPGIGLPIAISAAIGAFQLAEMASNEQRIQSMADEVSAQKNIKFKEGYTQVLSDVSTKEDKPDNFLTDDKDNLPSV